MQFRTQRGAVLNVTERTTRFALLSTLPDKHATSTGQQIVAQLPFDASEFPTAYECSMIGPSISEVRI
jgi:hypothetical protein